MTSSRGLASLTGPGLTVAVSGTDVSALVDALGIFVLNNVPAGDAQLRFSGPGTDATVTVASVTSGEEIRITVNVSGNRASLEHVTRPGSERRADNAEVEGGVTSGTCASFVVNGVTVTTNSATVFEGGTCGGITTGVEVEVKGTRQADGSVLARLVTFEDEDDDEEDEDDDSGKIELEGLVTAGGCGSFTVRGVVVTTNAATVFKNGRCSEIAPGARVHVRATRAIGGIVATLVNIQRDADDNGKSGDRDDDDDDADDKDDKDGDDDDEDEDSDDKDADRRVPSGGRRQ